MNLKRYLAYSLLGCLLLACGEGKEEYPATGIPIRFSCDVHTRGEMTTNDNITSMGVVAHCYTGDFDFNSSVIPNFMSNQLMERGNDGWTYSPMKYWPEGDQQKISFFAYSPYSDGNDASGLSVTGLMLTYDTPNVSGAHPDLLIAAPIENQTLADAPIFFMFSHKLARVSISFAGVGEEAVLSDVQLEGVKTKGTISLGDAGEWTVEDATGTVTYQYTLSTKEYMMLLPQLLTDDVKVSFKVNGELRSAIPLADYGISEWAAGKSYNYNITIK